MYRRFSQLKKDHAVVEVTFEQQQAASPVARACI